MVVAVFVYSVIPRPNIGFVIASRIVLVPVIAGLSYEVIRLAALGRFLADYEAGRAYNGEKM